MNGQYNGDRDQVLNLADLRDQNIKGAEVIYL
jgi:hypothetical protein